MSCDTYRIIDDGEIVIARGMPIETALILLKALFNEYWADTCIKYTIEKETDKLNGGQDADNY